MIRISVILFFLLILAGCASCPPEWFSQKPVVEGYRFGVGMSDPTYVESKARDLALTSALNDLARQKSVWVRSKAEHVATATSGWGQHSTSADTDVEVEGFEIIEEHFCDGSRGHQYLRGTYFVLIRISEERLLSR
jgi:hypothetical protein